MSIFDNATQVMIGNKEVQSIITSNGGVLYEKQSGDNYLLTLTSDKDILSYYDNDSALLTATLTNNGVGVQGEMVRFDGFLLDTPITRSITQNTETHVGNKYILNNIPITNLNKIFLNKEHTVYITKDAIDGVKIHWPNGGSGDETSNISVENGIITYSRGGTTYTEDCSSYDMSVVYSQVSGFSINDYGVFAVTDSSGVATVSYESKGTGDLNIKVDCMNLQETYTIEDCLRYDGTEHTESFTSTRFKTLATANETNVSVSIDLKSTRYDYSFVLSKGYNSESDQIGFGTTNTGGRIYRTLNGINNHSNYGSNNDNTYYNLRFEKTGTTLKLYLDDTLIDTSTDNAVSNLNYLNLQSWRNKTIYYKNLKIKPL